MADIAKCSGNKCPLKETCYRYKAPDSVFQFFLLEPPVKDGKCEYYWEMTKVVKTKKTKKNDTKRKGRRVGK